MSEGAGFEFVSEDGLQTHSVSGDELCNYRRHCESLGRVPLGTPLTTVAEGLAEILGASSSISGSFVAPRQRMSNSSALALLEAMHCDKDLR
jgi:hypothetical protein